MDSMDLWLAEQDPTGVEPCHVCEGTGRADGVACRCCSGTGMATEDDIADYQVPCPNCDGSGLGQSMDNNTRCSACHGSGLRWPSKREA